MFTRRRDAYLLASLRRSLSKTCVTFVDTHMNTCFFYINKSAGLNQGADCFLLKRCHMLRDNRGFIARDQCVNVSRKGRNGGVLCRVKGNEV